MRFHPFSRQRLPQFQIFDQVEAHPELGIAAERAGERQQWQAVSIFIGESPEQAEQGQERIEPVKLVEMLLGLSAAGEGQRRRDVADAVGREVPGGGELAPEPARDPRLAFDLLKHKIAHISVIDQKRRHGEET